MRKGNIKWLSCNEAYGGGGGMTRFEKKRCPKWICDYERGATLLELEVCIDKRSTEENWHLKPCHLSLKVGRNQNTNDLNATWILASIWFVIPLDLVCVFVMIKGDLFKKWHCGDNHAWTFKKVKHEVY